MQTRWQSAWSSFVGATVFFAILSWVSYAWERSTGFTFATRSFPSQVSTSAHLAHTRWVAIGASVLAVCFVVTYVLTRRGAR